MEFGRIHGAVVKAKLRCVIAIKAKAVTEMRIVVASFKFVLDGCFVTAIV
jgi:hypothetical protein